MIELETILAAIVIYCSYNDPNYSRASREACFNEAGNCSIFENGKFEKDDNKRRACFYKARKQLNGVINEKRV